MPRNQLDTPQVRMSGRWLAEAGFAAGSLLAVTVEPNRLVVTVAARTKPLPCHSCGKRDQ